MHAPSPCAPVPVETPWRIFLVFLRLGLSSFGGPLAHLATFARNSSSAGAGWGRRPMPSWSRCASFFPDLPAVRSASPWDCLAVACPGPCVPGPALPCLRPWPWHCWPWGWGAGSRPGRSRACNWWRWRWWPRPCGAWPAACAGAPCRSSLQCWPRRWCCAGRAWAGSCW